MIDHTQNDNQKTLNDMCVRPMKGTARISSSHDFVC